MPEIYGKAECTFIVLSAMDFMNIARLCRAFVKIMMSESDADDNLDGEAELDMRNWSYGEYMSRVWTTQELWFSREIVYVGDFDVTVGCGKKLDNKDIVTGGTMLLCDGFWHLYTLVGWKKRRGRTVWRRGVFWSMIRCMGLWLFWGRACLWTIRRRLMM